MTDAIDTSNDRINGVTSAKIREGDSAVDEGLGKRASVLDIFAYKNNEFYVVLFALNLIIRSLLWVLLPLFNDKKNYVKEYKKHIKESFAITVITFTIFYYMHYYTDAKDTLRGENNDCIKFTIFTLLLFCIFMYDYVNIFLLLVNKKFFSNKKNKVFLSIFIIVMIFILYYLTIVLSYGISPFNPFASKNFHSFILGSLILLLLFTSSFWGFVIININKINFNEEDPIKAIWGGLSKQNQSNNNNKVRKEFFIDMFKKYYMIFIIMSCILFVVLEQNKEDFYNFVNSNFPCKSIIETGQTS